MCSRILLYFQTTLEISGACDELKTVFTSLGEMLSDENLLSPYELHSSGLVQVLLHCLTGVSCNRPVV